MTTFCETSQMCDTYSITKICRLVFLMFEKFNLKEDKCVIEGVFVFSLNGGLLREAK